MKTISIKYAASGEDIEIKNVPLDHLLDVFVKIKLSTLTSLKFYDSQLTPDDINMISPIIPQRLSTLDLSNLSLNGKAISNISKRINCSRLQTLDLSYNPIGDGAIWSLVEAIGKNQYLKSLKFVNCDLTANGIWTLFNCMHQKKFDLLDISENLISSLGCDYVVQFLKQNPDLKELHIDRAQINEGDVGILIDAGEKCKTLSLLSIKGNGLISYRSVSQKVLVDTLPPMK